MKTPSKFPSSAYLGAVLLVLFFLLTCFQSQGQVSSAQKDTVLVFEKGKTKYARYPFYLDVSLESLLFFYLGTNANAGVYLNSKHAIGISYFTGATGNIFTSGDTRVRCIGLQYCGSPFKDPSVRKMFYYKIEAGKVLQYDHIIEIPDGFRQLPPNKKLSKPYMARATIGARFLIFNVYFAVGSTGKLVWDSTSYYSRSTSFRFFHITFGAGLTLPSRKIEDKKSVAKSIKT
jgi:hypothetical protein